MAIALRPQICDVTSPCVLIIDTWSRLDAAATFRVAFLTLLCAGETFAATIAVTEAVITASSVPSLRRFLRSSRLRKLNHYT